MATAGEWFALAREVRSDARRDNLGIVSAGVAFYALLALFPALAALIALYGLLADPAQVQQQIAALGGVMPPEAERIVANQLQSLANSSPRSLGLGLALAILLSLWSASKGMKALMTALNIVHGSEERRGFFRLNATALLLTFGAVVALLLALLMIAAVPALLAFIPLPVYAELLISLARWLLLLFAIAAALTLIYRFAPSARLIGIRKQRAATPGAILAALVWLATSILFSWYVGNFGNYNKTYGSVAAIVILLLWFSLGAYAILLGAELDSELAKGRVGRERE